MKKIILISILFITNYAQSQTWQWAVSCGKSLGDDIGTLAIDNNSNLYLSSFFYTTQGVYGNDTLIPSGINDIAFSKVDNNGNFIWTKQIGGNNIGPGIERASVYFDPASSSLLLSGEFYGNISLGNNTLTSVGEKDIFLSKFDANGNCIWAVKAGGIGNDDARFITTDANGNIYLIGQVGDTAFFDAHSIHRSYYFAKYNNVGNCLWVNNILDNPMLVQPDAYFSSISNFNNEVLLSGWTTNDTVVFAKDTLFANSLYGYDLMLAKFDLNGNLTWSKLDGGGVLESTTGAKYDNSGNIYATGSMGGDTAYFGSIMLPNDPGSEMFLVKYDNSGNELWARQTINSNNYRSKGFSVSQLDGSIYLTGNFQGTLTMGNFTVSNVWGVDVDLFIARYSANGDCLGLRNVRVDSPAPNPGGGISIAQDASNNCFVAGQFNGTSYFDSYSITSVAQKDIFIAKSDAITGLGGQNRVVQNQLIIYANPNKGTFNIKVPDEIKSFKQAWLFVYDMSGKEIARFNLDNESDTPHFDISNSNPGSYSVKLVQGEKVYSGKMVVE